MLKKFYTYLFFSGICALVYFFCAVPLVSPEEKLDSGKLNFNTSDTMPVNQQCLVAYSENYNEINGWLIGYEWMEGAWKMTFDSIPCSFGKKGLAPHNEKVEGDGRTPSGTFEIGAAFGYEPFPGIKMQYIKLEDYHYWISDIHSPKYNKLVDYYPGKLYAEKMRRTDDLYKFGIIIEYNTKQVIRGKGSAIFIHVSRKPGAPTAGCIAIAEKQMQNLIRWVDPNKQPIIKMGVREWID